MTLALFGGKPAVTGSLAHYNSIGGREIEAATQAMVEGPLSGYLGGNPWGGVYVQRLERMWEEKFGVDHAIACNSATAGLFAVASTFDDREFSDRYGFNVSPYTMSATVAAFALSGGQPNFVDVEPRTFCLDSNLIDNAYPTVVTNLFGHPAQLQMLRELCDANGSLLIEDNAQSPLARENGRYAGTIGHIGVFSLNVHKHIQCGEGGVVVTNDRVLADRIRAFTNHGEMASKETGLNLRMTEVTAAIALSQLVRADEIVNDRIFQARSIIKAVEDIPWLVPPVTREGCSHSYYTVPFTYNEKELRLSRAAVVKALEAEGFPLSGGYVKPLYHLTAFQWATHNCPVAEALYNTLLINFENCSWSPTEEQVAQFGYACRKIGANIRQLRKAF